MIIRATKKVLNINKIKPTFNETESKNPLPGDWFVDVISMGYPGKTALHFIHNPSRMVVLVPGKSIQKSMDEFKIRLSNLLGRHGFAARRFGCFLLWLPFSKG